MASKYDLLLRKARVVDPKNKIDQVLDVGIKDGIIYDVGEDVDYTNAEQIINLGDKLLIPGVIDNHVHVARPQAKGAGYKMVVKAGVTTVVDMEGPLQVIKDEINMACGLNIAVMEGMIPESSISSSSPSTEEIDTAVEKAIEMGAMGVKVVGGHYPFTPEATARIFAKSNEERVYAAFHVGTTATGSTIRGLEESVELAAGKPLHIAHVNAYCRGLVEDPLIELNKAMRLLDENPHLVSESHLAPFNGCSGKCWKGVPQSQVTRNCLRMEGYKISEEGVRKAILDGYAAVYAHKGGEMCLLWGKEAEKEWKRADTAVTLSFPVNLRTVAFACASQKNSKGQFLVDAISSDGGAIPRNFILKMGMAVVRFGGLTLPEFVNKITNIPAQILGLENKGHLTPGADADITIMDPVTGRALMTIIGGKVVMSHGYTFCSPGKILTTERGSKALAKEKLPHEVVDLEKGSYFKGRDSLY